MGKPPHDHLRHTNPFFENARYSESYYVMKRLQKLIAIFGILVFIAFTPMISFVFTPMSVLGMAVGIALFVFGLFMPRILAWAKKHKVITWAVCILLAIVLVWALICSALLFAAGIKAPKDSDTVIVLGCQLRGDKPSKMLKQRLDKAYEYLCENPDAVAIMSGGQGGDEIMPEAVAMYNYLVEKNVDPARLFIESDSHNTEQNMEYSAKIIEENSLDTNVVVITQAFHQYRASVYAKEAGLTAYALNCKTNPGTLPTYWLRELFAVIKMYLVLI